LIDPSELTWSSNVAISNTIHVGKPMNEDASLASLSAEPIVQSEVSIDKQRLGAVYARALLGATEPKQLSEIAVDELDALVDEVLRISPALEMTLASPRVAPVEKAKLLDRIFAGRISDQTLTFLKVVARHGRLDCIRQIRRAARDELNRLRNRVAVQVTTATELHDELRHRIVAQLQSMLGQDVYLECRVDDSILGGLVVRVGDTVYDSSVARQLQHLKEQTIHKTRLQLRESIDRFAITG
jgi:F-type H+-transporting ATPase subunit delta